MILSCYSRFVWVFIDKALPITGSLVRGYTELILAIVLVSQPPEEEGEASNESRL